MIIEHYLQIIIPYISGSLEIIGVLIIALAGIQATIMFIQAGINFGDEHTTILLAKALSLSLSFNLAAEILKTVTVQTMEQFTILAGVATLRVALYFVLYWELNVAITSGLLNKKKK